MGFKQWYLKFFNRNAAASLRRIVKEAKGVEKDTATVAIQTGVPVRQVVEEAKSPKAGVTSAVILKRGDKRTRNVYRRLRERFQALRLQTREVQKAGAKAAAEAAVPALVEQAIVTRAQEQKVPVVAAEVQAAAGKFSKTRGVQWQRFPEGSRRAVPVKVGNAAYQDYLRRLGRKGRRFGSSDPHGRLLDAWEAVRGDVYMPELLEGIPTVDTVLEGIPTVDTVLEGGLVEVLE